MSFWWLEPGWKQACCNQCGVNIWDSGGDPDHGLCFSCMNTTIRRQQHDDELRRDYEQEMMHREAEINNEAFRRDAHRGG